MHSQVKRVLITDIRISPFTSTQPYSVEEKFKRLSRTLYDCYNSERSLQRQKSITKVDHNVRGTVNTTRGNAHDR